MTCGVDLKGVWHQLACTYRKPKTASIACESADNHGDGRSPQVIWYAVAGLLRSRAGLQTEILALRHQLNVLTRRSPKRVAVSNIDRLVFAGLYHLAPEVLDAVKILKPETIIRWHCAGFRAWWRWKSRPRRGRPRTPDEIRQLVREMSVANPLWGAPRIHGELRKLA